jgi:hypothetical protein
MTISGSLITTGNGIDPAFHVPVFIGKHADDRGRPERREEERALCVTENGTSSSSATAVIGEDDWERAM